MVIGSIVRTAQTTNVFGDIAISNPGEFKYRYDQLMYTDTAPDWQHHKVEITVNDTQSGVDIYSATQSVWEITQPTGEFKISVTVYRSPLTSTNV